MGCQVVHRKWYGKQVIMCPISDFWKVIWSWCTLCSRYTVTVAWVSDRGQLQIFIRAICNFDEVIEWVIYPLYWWSPLKMWCGEGNTWRQARLGTLKKSGNIDFKNVQTIWFPHNSIRKFHFRNVGNPMMDRTDISAPISKDKRMHWPSAEV